METATFQAMLAGLKSDGLRDSKIAREIGVRPSTVFRLSQGNTRFPRHETVVRLADYHQRYFAHTQKKGV